MLSLKDAATGSAVSSLTYPKAYTPITAVVLNDMNSNGKSEIAVVGKDAVANDVQATNKDAATNSLIKIIPIP